MKRVIIALKKKMFWHVYYIICIFSCENDLAHNELKSCNILKSLSYKFTIKICINDTNDIGKYPTFMVSDIQINGNDLDIFPTKIQLYHNCTYFEINNPHFIDFPDEICNLKNIKSIVFRDNNFQHIPICIFTLKKVQELWLYGIKLRNIPDSIISLTGLERLSLSINENPIFPDGFFKLKRLKYFELSRVSLRNKKERIHFDKKVIENVKKIFRDSLPNCDTDIDGY